MKKFLALFAALVLCICCFAGCAGNGGAVAPDLSEVDELPAFDTSKEVTIKFYHTMGSNLTAVLDQYIAEFNTLYPNIHVEYTSVGSYDDVRDQVSTEITVGAQPNIAYCYPDHVALYNLAMAVQTLDDLIASETVVRLVGATADFILSDENGGRTSEKPTFKCANETF